MSMAGDLSEGLSPPEEKKPSRFLHFVCKSVLNNLELDHLHTKSLNAPQSPASLHSGSLSMKREGAQTSTNLGQELSWFCCEGTRESSGKEDCSEDIKLICLHGPAQVTCVTTSGLQEHSIGF